MRLEDDSLWLSPSDLANHLGCAHATTLALRAVRKLGASAARGGPYEALIGRKGEAHEAHYLHALEEAGRDVRRVPTEVPIAEAVGLTEEAMRGGVEVIYQATFADDGWSGRADFLERVPFSTGLGPWGYEAVDTKLARHDATPRHVLQLGVYSQAIERMQGVAPAHMHLQLGSGRRETIRVRDAAAYVRHAQRGLRRFIEADRPTEPYPCQHCTICGFRSQCEAWWTERDHLTRVAGIRRGHVDALDMAGISTLTGLAESPPATQVPDLPDDVFAELRWQAKLQLASRRSGQLEYELRPPEGRRGLCRLPRPSPGDVFLDFEGDPVWSAAQELIFLFGIVEFDGDQWRYRAWWGHDRAEQTRAFEAVVDHMVARRVEHPDMHVYHYSAAEPSAFRRLATLATTREAEIDELLRGEVFCDLLTVTRQALVLGAESYGLKTAERLAGFRRGADVGSGSDAVVLYETWIESGKADQGRLDQIERYNEEDVRATLALRDWLIAQRPAGLPWWTKDGSEEPTPPKPVADAELARRAIRDQLAAAGQPIHQTAADLMGYHSREARPAWWFWYDRQEKSPAELRRDGEALAHLTPADRGTEPHTKQSDKHWLTYPEQDHKIGPGGNYTDPATVKGVTVVEVDDDARLVAISRAKKRAGEALPAAIVPGGAIRTDAQKDALARLGQSILDGDDRYPASVGVLGRDLPRFGGRPPGAPLQSDDIAEQITLAVTLDDSHLIVQGPPGAGKTYLGGRMICALIEAGERVGVMSGSHKAINNLLDSVVAAADQMGLTFRGARKMGTNDDAPYDNSDQIENVKKNEDCADPAYRLVAGTSWLFAAGCMDQTLDVLVIDEAGQMSLADTLAAGTSARNLVLLGDPMQLPQVTQATHPDGTGVSVLDHLLNGETTVPTDRGLFLTTTWRLHPDICRFISRQVYDDRLVAHPDCGRQATTAGTGIRHMPVTHTGRTSSSREEAEAIRDEISRLVDDDWTDTNGVTRRLSKNDIMVVAPYNSHVRMLKSVLSPEVSIGTVDKFQGQEAPVVFFSMATSTGEDMPRDVGFLFSRNRLNVAISRARCLAYLVCSPALLDATPRTVDDLRLISTLCALVEEARHD